jgi:hypothetical protein
MQVALDEAPDQPGAPANAPKFHCPLCVMAFLGGFNPPLQAPPFLFSTCTVAPDAHCASMPSGTEVQLPQGRAPPAITAI